MQQLMPTINSSLTKIIQVLDRDIRASNVNEAGAAYICLIPFNDRAERTPLTARPEFKHPQLVALGKTQLGLALTALNESLDSELIAPVLLPDGTTQPGDLRPLVFLMTDGKPSIPEKAPWRPQAERLRERRLYRPWKIVGLAIGAGADVATLQAVADVTLSVTGNPEQLTRALRDFFNWIVETVDVTRNTITGHGVAPVEVALPPTPETITTYSHSSERVGE
jgi:uncharacterized protein YegL